MSVAKEPMALARTPRQTSGTKQDTMPSRYSFPVRILSMLAFTYVAFAFVNGRFLHWFESADGEAPLWLSHWSEYVVILIFGIWRTLAEKNSYTRKRLGFITFAVAVFWWMIPDFLRLPEPYVGSLPGQPIFPHLHTPGTLTFFGILLLVLLFGRRVVCGWNCPCVGIRETVGFAFRENTLRSGKAWNWRYTKWFFFALYMGVFVMILIPGTQYVSPLYSGFLALVGATYFGSFFIAPLTGNRFYCRYLCPYGATFGLLNHLGFYGIRMDKDACIDCQRCQQACDMGIPVWQQGKQHGRVTGLEDCMGCGRCIVSCPTDALEFRDIRNIFSPKLRMDGSYLMRRSGPPQIAPRIEPPDRPAEERCKDWQEDQQPLNLDKAIAQARRCLDCGVPGCQNACPLNNRIPEWLEALGKGDIEGAAELCHTTSNLPDICGTLCPAHKLCEGGCTLNASSGAVTISALESFIAREALQKGWRPSAPRVPANGKSVAVIGAGPAGLACADELNKAGFGITVFDQNNEIGGLLRYGVPSFKLDKSLITRRHKMLEEAGIDFALDTRITEITMPQLLDSNDAVFVATGLDKPRLANIPGENLVGVIDALAYLRTVNTSALSSSRPALGMSDKRVVVLGGGDTAIDCARSALRQGAISVTIAYRRGAQNMRASRKEVSAARDEGVAFMFHMRPKEFVGGESLNGVIFISESQQPGDILVCDAAIVAFGQQADSNNWLLQLGIATDERGFICADEYGRTVNPKVFVGGDNTHGPDLVVTGVAAGRRASQSIQAALQ